MKTNQSNITPFLWFNGNVEEAVNFYVSVFKNSQVLNMNQLPGDVPGHKGKVFTATIELDGQKFMLLDGGPQFKFSPAVSFFVNCTTQKEVDDLWEKLSESGKPNRCGWIDDKFGVTWQIVPKALGELMGDPDRKKAKRVMEAMMQMGKIEIKKLEEAYNQK
jgi:predicted 3-demethylubiquinone-9 3-methyltransferase (glyoxalase superfamily)